MAKTVKELIVKIKQEIKLCNSALAVITLEDLINKYENELAEKDRKIDLLLIANREITYSTKSREYNQQQLYEEDFYQNPYSAGSIDWILVDSSKYEKLPNKMWNNK